MASKTGQIINQLKQDNPKLLVVEGGPHVKLFFRGKFVGILPNRLRTEGLAQNSRAQFRRAGMKVTVLCPGPSSPRKPSGLIVRATRCPSTGRDTGGCATRRAGGWPTSRTAPRIGGGWTTCIPGFAAVSAGTRSRTP